MADHSILKAGKQLKVPVVVKRHQSACRARYWASGKLAKRKIRNLGRHSLLFESEARAVWLATRTRYFGVLA